MTATGSGSWTPFRSDVPMRIAVTGRTGQIASCLAEAGAEKGIEIVLLGRPDLDLADPTTVLPAFAAVRPDLIVSCAAYTQVDRAEAEPDLAFRINRDGAAAV